MVNKENDFVKTVTVKMNNILHRISFTRHNIGNHRAHHVTNTGNGLHMTLVLLVCTRLARANPTSKTTTRHSDRVPHELNLIRHRRATSNRANLKDRRIIVTRRPVLNFARMRHCVTRDITPKTMLNNHTRSGRELRVMRTVRIVVSVNDKNNSATIDVKPTEYFITSDDINSAIGITIHRVNVIKGKDTDHQGIDTIIVVGQYHNHNR